MEQIKLTSSEWNILNCLWERSPRPVMQIANELEQTVGWHRSTTITTLHRMEAKGLVRCEQAETGSFLDRVYQGSVGMMMSAMAQRQQLSANEEIMELRAILDQAEKGGPQ